MIDLRGKVAVITGGSRGIGLAVSGRLFSQGAHVAMLDRTGGDVQAVAGELHGEKRAIGLRVDITDPIQAETALATVERELGPVDILVNNAGITRDGVLVRMSHDDWDTVLDVNLRGAFTMTKLVTRGMMKRRWGRIINIASVVGITGNRGQANYAASKAGLIGLTKAAAKELASRNILCNAIAPGFIDTEMTRGLSNEARQVLLDQIPLKRLGNAGEIAAVVLFLASDLANYITGQVLVVDGGMVT
jgi:3-oxoacyl-[acyl-carrier protein] reductase